MQYPCALAALVIVSTLALASAQPFQNKWTESNGKFTPSEGTASAADCTGDKDLFPSKAHVTHANFEITYHKYYKIVNNKHAKKKYVLYQRGCPNPNVAGADDAFEIPLRSVALSSSTYFPVMHYMGEKPAVRLYLSNNMYSTNACMQQQVDSGHTMVDPAPQYQLTWGANWKSHSAWEVRPAALKTSACKNCTCDYYSGALSNSSEIHNCSACSCGRDTTVYSALDSLNIEASFVSFASSYKKEVMISSSSEEVFYGVGEWAEFFGVFFNKESAVTNLADERRQRWLDQSAQVYPQSPKPKVLLLDAWYKEGNSWGQSTGWYLQTCKGDKCPGAAGGLCASERWCDLVKAAGGDPINKDLSDFAAKIDGSQAGSKQGISDEELKIWAKDADYVILKAGNCQENTIPTGTTCVDWWKVKLEENLKGIKGVDAKKVWDMQRRLDPNGGSAALEYEKLEPDVVMQDFIKILDPTYDHNLVFLRNVFTEGMGNDKKCKDLTDEALKTAEVGCRPDMAEMIKKCNDHSATQDVLVFMDDGFKLFAKDSKIVLAFDVTLPYTKDEFDKDKQTKYVTAVARAANTARANVDIKSIHDAPGRRAGSIIVGTAIRSVDEAGLDALSTTLGTGDSLKNKINSELRAMGLKEATAISDPVKQTGFSGAARAPATWALTAAACAFALAFLA